MRAVRQCLSLTLTILCFGVIDTAWFEAAFAEGSTTSSYRIIATYRVDFGGFNLGNFRLTTVLRGSWEVCFMRGAVLLQARVG